MNKYTAITFAPVQGFIEKSRKLRDLYGASLILSYLSQQLVKYVEESEELALISPAMPNLQKGMTNRILITGELSRDKAKEILLSAWKNILQVCRTWIERQLAEYQYHWEREWTLWRSHTWEIFCGQGDTIQAAMDDLETQKLCRDWSAVNWIGESSSLTGTDAIAFPGLGAKTRNPKFLTHNSEHEEIKKFYTKLARILDKCPPDQEPEGKYIAPNEKLSIPELVKRLITWYKVAQELGIKELEESFKEIQRKPEPNQDLPGQWTGWFMGDGDKVGDYLKKLANENNGNEKINKNINNFSHAMRIWAKNFDENFSKELGRIVYAGGDDFLGIIYSKNPTEPIKNLTAYKWLLTLKNKWQEHKQSITVSVGFVWVAGSVPQRDVLQHCREAEKVAKSLGRDRVTIRVVFNSGQYVEWTCPWDYLHILNKYQDRDRKTFAEWESKGKNKIYFPNWSHVYSDLAHLESRRTFKIENAKSAYIIQKSALEFFDIYFPGEGKKLLNDKDNKLARHLAGFSDNDDAMEMDRAKATIDWMSDLIQVGWHLCSNT
ncbi:Cas10/Cmr2 second palm domain-containing protein [Umezakia ovalisporum]|uniref:CRISPR-associated protein Cmr2 n=1 Tax=Umezakia ovalisporum FSS-62 TaxID=2971776 RepID=A0AA43KDY6_9CYAN|nr:type III-B CRISPR-associated protein Cas10/Cmr2 [Umezakia ovalisporum]MDH6062922.1 CRISPR-associated protein Cmr2 [Umezakia ovalisporum FSS-62]